MKRTNRYARVVSAFFMMFLFMTTSIYGAFALSISNVVVTPRDTSAVVSFTTDTDAYGYVNVSQGSTGTVFPGVDDSVEYAKTHTIVVPQLLANTTYAYQIFAEDVLNNRSQKSSTSQFTTRDSGSSATYLDIAVPEFITGAPLSLRGVTVPNALVKVYVNTVLTQTVTASSAGILSINSLVFERNAQQQEIVFEVFDSQGQTVTKKFNVIIDNADPVMTINDHPTYTNQETLLINGTIDKTVTIKSQVLYHSGQVRLIDDVHATGLFGISVPLDQGANEITITATDRAGRVARYSTTVTLDSELPRILEHNLNSLSPTYSTSITVKGKVNKPNIDVQVVVFPQEDNIGPCDPLKTTVTVDGKIPNQRCRQLFGLDGSNEGQTYHVRSDANGNFEVDATMDVIAAISERVGVNDPNALQAIPANSRDTAASRSQLTAGIRVASSYDLYIIATDKVGNHDMANGRVDYAVCGDGTNWIVTPGEFYPTIMQPDHIYNGIAQISFTLNTEYIGPGRKDTAQVTSARMIRQPLSEFDQTKFAPEQILDPSACRFFPESGFSAQTYVVCNLAKYPPERLRNITAAYEKLEDMKSIKFPLILDFSYSFENDAGKPSTGIYRSCFDPEVFIDRRLPPEYYPSKLLNASVEVLDTTVKTIDQILKPLKTIKLVTLGACFGTNIVNLFSFASEEAACIKLAKPERQKVEQTLRGCSGSDCAQVQALCQGMGDQRSADCQSCADRIQSRLKLEKFSHTVCDRVFCPKVPSAQQYIKEVTENRRKSPTSACFRDAGGNQIWYSTTLSVASSAFTKEEGCGKEYNDQWASGCLIYDEFAQSQKIAREGEGNKSTSIFGDFVENLNFCSAANEDDKDKPDFFYDKRNLYYRSGTDNADGSENCYTMGTDLAAAGKFQDTSKNTYVVDQSTKYETVQAAYINPDALRQRKVTQCVATDKDGYLFYQFQDPQDPTKPLKYDPSTASSIKVTDVKGGEDVLSVTSFKHPTLNQDAAVDAEGNYYLSDAGVYKRVDLNSAKYDQFFSRVCKKGAYNQETYDVYDPNVKTGGCVPVPGSDKLKQEKIKQVLIDPTSGFINSLRCVCLPAIEGYLTVIRNVLNAIKNCFQAVLVTKEFRGGACRALLTQYLCDWIFEAIKCFARAAGALDKAKGVGTERQDGLVSGLGALQRGATRMTESVRDRYGDTATYQALISQRKLLHAVCLAAFGYDWVPELDQAASISGGGFSINSTAFIQPATRRFISSNPSDHGTPTFIYHIGYFMSAGANLNYQLDLVCSTDNSCNANDGFPGGRCDCAYPQNQQRSRYPVDSGRVAGGATLGDADGRGERYISISAPVRYDKVRLSWRDETKTGNSGEVIVPISAIGDPLPPTCYFSLILFQFSCDYNAVNKYGDVYFYGDKIRVQEFYRPDDKLAIEVYARQDFEGVPEVKQVPKFARLQLFYGDYQVLYTEVTGRNILSRSPIIMGADYRIEIGDMSSAANKFYSVNGSPSSITSIGQGKILLDNTHLTSVVRSLSNQFDYYIWVRAKSGGGVEFRAIRHSLATAPITGVNLAAFDANPSAKTLVLDNGLLRVDIENGVNLRLAPDYVAKVGESLLVEFSVLQSSGILCTPNVDKVTMKARVTLHDGRSRHPNEEPSYANAEFDPKVFISKGELQQVEKDIVVYCRTTSNTFVNNPAPKVATCPVNVLLDPARFNVIVNSPNSQQPKEAGCLCNGVNLLDKLQMSDKNVCVEDIDFDYLELLPLCEPSVQRTTPLAAKCLCADVKDITSAAAVVGLSACGSSNKCVRNTRDVPVCT